MNLSLQRMTEIIEAKIRMAEDSLANHRETYSDPRVELDELRIEAIVSARECVARRNLALSLLSDLKQAEQIATISVGNDPKALVNVLKEEA